MNLSVLNKSGWTVALTLAAGFLAVGLYQDLQRPILPASLAAETAPYTVRKVDLPLAEEKVEALQPVLRLDLLEKYRSRRPANSSRDLFEFYEIPRPMPKAAPPMPEPGPSNPVGAANAGNGANAVGPAGAPPAAPLSFRYLGYFEDDEGSFEAILKDQERIYLVHEGDRVGKNFIVARITSSTVELENEINQIRRRLRFVP